MKLFLTTIRRLREFFEIFSQLVFTKNLISYTDLHKFWESLFYVSAICGAALILAAKLATGGLVILCSFLFYKKAFRYEFGNTKNSELTAAIYNQDVEYVKHVLENRSDPNKIDAFGHTPLILAIHHGGNETHKIIDLLVGHGAKLTDDGKRKPLDEAIQILKNSDAKKSKNSTVSLRNLKVVKHIIEAEDKQWSNSEQFVEFLVENDLYERLA